MDDTNIIIITESENMDTRTILRKVKDGSLSIEEAELAFGRQPYEELGYAKQESTPGISRGYILQ